MYPSFFNCNNCNCNAQVIFYLFLALHRCSGEQSSESFFTFLPFLSPLYSERSKAIFLYKALECLVKFVIHLTGKVRLAYYLPLMKKARKRWATLILRRRSVASFVSVKVQSGKVPSPAL